MLLKELVKGLEVCDVRGNLDIDIKDIAYDSRKTKKNGVFVCIDGYKQDGHKFIRNAIDNKVSAVFVQRDVPQYEGVTIIKVKDTRRVLAHLSNVFFNEPSKDLNVVGVTGTKGKTTTTYMVKSILEKFNQKVGIIGTIVNKIGDYEIESSRTTPECYDLQKLFREMKEQDVESVVMEVSSHALELSRVEEVDFDIGAFTNLSQDHLDFHKTIDNYLESKIKLFSLCKKGVVNIDNIYGSRVVEKALCDVYTFGIHNEADFMAYDIETYPSCVKFKVKSAFINEQICVNIPGVFSVYNALCAISISALMGVDAKSIKEGLKDVVVPGRAEIIEANDKYTIMVDYAHSPDSLENILKTVKEYAKGRVVSVFGCGGDRDTLKRPIMGRISGDIADFTIITSDNPRTEEPQKIIEDIENGIKDVTKNYVTITDRRDAIKYAIDNSQYGDIIVLAGKGHETYQIFKDKTIHFDEREVVSEILN